jgi:hypothetical protein
MGGRICLWSLSGNDSGNDHVTDQRNRAADTPELAMIKTREGGSAVYFPTRPNNVGGGTQAPFTSWRSRSAPSRPGCGCYVS